LGLDPKTTPRIVFNEITKPAIHTALENARTIDMDLVSAQKSRAVLDKVV
jgi:DNA topoisomerase-1